MLHGSLFMAGASVLLRAVSLLKHVALGWLLTKTEFGVYGIAVSLTAFVACFRDNGIHKLLVQRPAEIARLTDAAFLWACAMNVIACIALVIIGIAYSALTGIQQLVPLLFLLGLSLIIGSATPVLKARVTSSLNFRGIATVSAASQSIAHLLTIPFAALGFGVYSFVAPVFVERILELLGYRRLTSPIRLTGLLSRVRRADIRELAGGLKWIMASAAATAFILNGDYFVLGLMVDPITVGIYFFGFQLTTTLSQLFTSQLGHVFMPIVASLKGDPKRQFRAYQSALREITEVAFPLSAAMALLVGPMIHLLWGGRWDQAIIVAQSILLVLPIRLASPLSRAFLEARGRWAAVTALQVCDVVGVLTAAALGGYIGTVPAIAVAIAVWQVAIGFIQLVLVPTMVGERPWRLILEVAGLAVVVCLSLLVATWASPSGGGLMTHSVVAALASAGVFLASYVLASLVWAPHRLRRLGSNLRSSSKALRRVMAGRPG
jgi:PST family polysaccharide transporter